MFLVRTTFGANSNREAARRTILGRLGKVDLRPRSTNRKSVKAEAKGGPLLASTTSSDIAASPRIEQTQIDVVARHR